jgi:thiamine-monophosphate kinase
VVGGDLSGGPVIVVAVTVHGDLAGRAPVRRDGARPGDVLALAGTLGRSAAGLALLDAGAPQVDPAAVAVYRRPQPPLAAGPVAAAAGATAMLDVSDGLLRDAGRIARASGVAIDVAGTALAADLAAVGDAARALGADPLAWVLIGGEDHGLLATFPAGTVPAGFRTIGRVVAADGDGAGPGDRPGAVRVDGRPGAELAGGVGWDHFHR